MKEAPTHTRARASFFVFLIYAVNSLERGIVMSTNSTKKHSDLKKIAVVLFVLALVVIALFATGCSTPATPTPDPEASAAAAPAEEEPAPEPEDDGTFAFGETVTYADNLSISVSAPSAYTPSDTAAGMVAGQSYVVFEVVVTNNTGATYEPMVFNTASSAGQEASMISDVAQSVGFGPTTAVLDGQTIKWHEAYSVADPASITLQVSAGFEYDDAIFTTIQ